MTKEKDEKITIRVPRELKEWFAEEADRKDISVSQIVRVILEDYRRENYGNLRKSESYRD